jgi:hypothetical protein
MVLQWSGQEPVLPKILRNVPTITMREGDDPDDVRLDSSVSIQPGCELYPFSPYLIILDLQMRDSGTLGFLATLSKSKGDSCHVIVTVGHILDTADADALDVEIDADDQTQKSQTRRLRPIPSCERGAHGRPKFRWHWPGPRPCLDEICLIETKELPADQIKCSFPYDIDCNAFFPLPKDSDPAYAAAYAGLVPKVKDIVKPLRRKIPLTVHKRGAKTGVTQLGLLWRLQDSANIITKKHALLILLT